METQAPVRFVWRLMMRRVWQCTSRGDMRKVWRQVWHRVRKTEVSSSALSTAWDTQSITYADVETFFEAVTEGSKHKLNLMLYETYGPDVTAELAKCYNEDGETPLLVAIRQQNLEMVKYLTKKLKVPISQHERLVWKGFEYSQVPPLLAAILGGKTEIIRYLMAAEMQFGQTFASIDSIISSSNDRQQKIDVLELLGAAYLCFYQLHGTREAGLHCWKAAMSLRNLTSDGSQVIPKPEISFSSDAARKAFGFTSELTTLEQLEQLNASDLELLAQSVLVSQRILNDISPGANLFILANLRQYVDMCLMEENYSRVICTAIVFFEYFQQYQWKNSETSTTTSVIIDFTTKCFKNLRNGPRDNRQEFTFANLMIAFEFASGFVTDLQRAEGESRGGTSYDLAWDILEMVVLIVEMFPQLNAFETQRFKRCLYLFIRTDHRWGKRLRNFLHMVCRCDDPPPSERPIDWIMADFDDEQIVSSCNSDVNEDDTDRWESICSSCGNYHDSYVPNDNDEDMNMIDVGNQYREGEVRDVVATLRKRMHLSLIRLFLELGADPNSTDAEGLTALHLLAMHSEHMKPIKLVMEHGGHVDQTDRYGLTPLMHLKRWQTRLTVARMVKPRLLALINRVRPLICLAAQVLSENRVPLDLEIPAALCSFVSRH